MGHNHFFDQLRAASFPPNTAPMGGLGQTNEVPPFGHCLPTPFGFYADDVPLEAVPSAHFSSSWDTSSLIGAPPANLVLKPHGVGFYDTLAGFASSPGYSRAVTKTPQFTPVNYYYPPAIQGQAAFALQRSTHPQINYLGEQASPPHSALTTRAIAFTYSETLPLELSDLRPNHIASWWRLPNNPERVTEDHHAHAGRVFELSHNKQYDVETGTAASIDGG
ncbi:hypothetical protein BD779DRAFT_1682857 [Infundibulicybe gibba]|nr:hypothetical protein BD779DRAFT_1682857 [Infundibulicybe gibba]